MTDTTTNTAPRLLRLPEVKALIGLGTTSIYTKMNEGSFPRPVKLGGRSARWIEHEIQDWIAGRIAARDEGHDHG